ncbi:tyrosine-type recombinase/integrase [Clostridium perfringens]|uniref:tyrosine-type recombinase/integrase n=1 Tax=Clostridium perfringens TaxID=1502 RepID=UPI00189A438D|nr:tyrosine-type recombinase/integrase [Clostridium perfringens]HBI6962465.1 tyrosine-type recombinase/integrase [Clostridium perfringens]
MKKEINQLLSLENKNGLSEGTLKKYEIDLNLFFEYMEHKQNIKSLDNVTREEGQKIIDRYINYLKREGYKPSTINGKVVSINKFLKYLGYEFKAKAIKIQNKMYIENIISEREFEKIIRACKDNKRDYTIIMTLANTGLRVSELLSLTINDTKKKSIYIYGKGGKGRELILSPQLKKLLNNYIENYRMKTHKRLLFTGERGALKRNAINKMLLKYQKKTGISKEKMHPHSFRHFYAKYLINKGVGLDVIQTLLGHENINTTAIYTKGSKKEIESIINNNFIA